MTTIEDLLAGHPLLPLAWTAAGRAGAFLHHERPASLRIETKTTAVDAVTEMDRGAEERIIAAIVAERPNDGIVGEEGGERLGTSGTRWIVDPLDGTVNYLYRHAHWAVSIGVEVAGELTVGVIVAPALDEAYVGWLGGGAWLVRDGVAEPMEVSGCTDLAMALVGTGFGYRADRRAAQAGVVAELLPVVRDVRRAGAASVDLAWVAAGRLDAYYERGLQVWDLAAGAVIAREAGARIASLSSADLSVGTLVASTPGIDLALRSRLREID